MRPYSILVVVLLFLLPGDAVAARWQKDTVPVWSFVPDEWQPYVQATVDDFNANMPPEVPRLVYTPMGELPCSQLPKTGRKGGITVCVKDGPAGDSDADVTYLQGRIYRAVIALDPPSLWEGDITVCHEMMHALTNVSDDTSLPHLDTSCVLGNLDHLGAWDISFVERVYASPSHGSSHHHTHHHARHH